jgi:glyoxylase-like metal-dependent hydrolase (beta-lactamase superfamily II)
MAEVKVLIEGYAEKNGNGWVASSTTCLVRTNNVKIITDPGCNREKLFNALKGENLTTADIDYVFLSHCHPDHILLAGIFEKAKFITFDSNLIYDNDTMIVFSRSILGEDIEIIETPGHVLEHLSLLVDTPNGKVAIAGDVIWWMQSETQKFDLIQVDHSQAKGMDMNKLIESRKRLIASADYIIPGHGKIFKVQK